MHYSLGRAQQNASLPHAFRHDGVEMQRPQHARALALGSFCKLVNKETVCKACFHPQTSLRSQQMVTGGSRGGEGLETQPGSHTARSTLAARCWGAVAPPSSPPAPSVTHTVPGKPQHPAGKRHSQGYCDALHRQFSRMVRERGGG